MASNSTRTAIAKPTFAKVAASSYKPSNTTQSNSSKNTSSKAPANTPDKQNASSSALKDPQSLEKIPMKIVNEKAQCVAQKRENAAPVVVSSQPEESSLAVKAIGLQNVDAQSMLEGSSKLAPDDGSTQVSSSDGSQKQPGFDSKSIASVNTFAMDEKDSVRPDDSASIRAVEEEDAFSAPGTGPTGSRVGSDCGARAFRDQLHHISVMGAMASRGGPAQAFQPAAILKPGAPFGGSGASQPAAPQTMTINGIPVPSRPGNESYPDSKLLEALDKPQDRVFVLKLEQDVTDFVQNTKEMQLDLPKTHSFYRMLAHKLADYFMLDHSAEHHGDGLVSVVIRKTPMCRIPPPLSNFSNPSTNSTPPPAMPARKIMRRGDGANTASGPSTSMNSENPSKATSEVGDASGASDTGARATPIEAQVKATMTREEREAKYKEARERIFGTTETSESKEGDKSDENDISRSSSAAGKKKQRKKTPINDDDFQTRSQFAAPSSFYQPQFGSGVYSDGVFYPQYPQAIPGQQYQGMPQGQPQMGYSNSYPQMASPEQQMQYPYQAQPFSPYQNPTAGGFDLSAQFQRGMQSFQNASPSPQIPPNMASPQPPQQPQFSPHFPVQPQAQPYSQAWQQPMSFGSPYPYGQPGYAQPQLPDRPLSSPGQLPPSPYPYAQPPNIGFPGAQSPYIRGGQFNPQTQAFTPTTNMRPPMSMSPQMPSYGANAGMPMPTPMGPGYRSISSGSYSGSHSGGYNSPRPVPPSTMTNLNPGLTSAPTATNVNGQQGNQGTTHPLPQRPAPDSSISKWDTPSHLPPRPPPPESMEPHKYNELNRGLQGLPGMPKITGNGVFASAMGAAPPPAGSR